MGTIRDGSMVHLLSVNGKIAYLITKTPPPTKIRATLPFKNPPDVNIHTVMVFYPTRYNFKNPRKGTNP